MEKIGEEWRGEWRIWQSHTRDQAVDSTTTLPRASVLPFAAHCSFAFGSSRTSFFERKFASPRRTSGMHRRIAVLIASLALVSVVRSGEYPRNIYIYIPQESMGNTD